MARNVTQYDLLISCPGDIKDEVELVDQAVNEFNTMFSDTIGITIRTKHWSKNSYAQSGGKPQSLLNEQFVKDCDAAVALFWTRFGTRTDDYGSGTEEEIEIMLEAGKQVFMYFSDKPVPPSQHNPTEYARIQAFREKYKDRGLYFTYSSNEDFHKLFFAHLTQHFIAEKRVAEVRAERKSELTLRGIDENEKLSSNGTFQKLKFNTDHTLKGDVEKIKSLIREISDIHLQTIPGSLGAIYRGFNTPVELNQNLIDTITEAARALKIQLPDDFFCIGNLTKKTLAAPTLFGNPSYDGSAEEKKKHSLIQELYRTIDDACIWGDIEQGFADIMCVKLALTNIGTSADEDIDVAIKVHKTHYLSLTELPKLKTDAMRYLTRECSISELLGIKSTAEYGDYDSSLIKTPQFNNIRSGSGLPFDVDYEEDYKDELDDVFCFDVYEDGEYYVIKLKFDYLKHNTTVAFPAAILLKEAIDSIPYTITSKNSSEVIEGEISIN